MIFTYKVTQNTREKMRDDKMRFRVFQLLGAKNFRKQTPPKIKKIIWLCFLHRFDPSNRLSTNRDLSLRDFLCVCMFHFRGQYHPLKIQNHEEKNYTVMPEKRF